MPKIDSTLTFVQSDFSYTLSNEVLNEVSGMAPSYNFPGNLWVNEDSEAQAGIHLISDKGVYQRFVRFNGTNRDFEDMATGPGPNDNLKYIYVGDIGDNGAIYKDYQIYRFPEPTSNQTQVNQVDVINFKYPDNQSYNSETLLLDPKTKDLYIITKDQFNVRVYILKYPQSISTINTAEFLGTIPLWGITGGDISADGKEIILKTYIAAFYWKRKDGESIFEALKRDRDIGLPYQREPQGEAICWDTKAEGYFTLSERGSLPEIPKLYNYKKKWLIVKTP